MKASLKVLLVGLAGAALLGAGNEASLAGSRTKRPSADARSKATTNITIPLDILQLGVIPVGITITNYPITMPVPTGTELQVTVERDPSSLIETDALISVYVIPTPTAVALRPAAAPKPSKHHVFKNPKFPRNSRYSDAF